METFKNAVSLFLWSYLAASVIASGQTIEDALGPSGEESPFSEPDPFADSVDDRARVMHVLEEWEARNTASALLRLEVFEVPTMASIQLFDKELPSDQLRAAILKMVAEEKASVSSMHAVRSEVGLSFTTEMIVEQIYPTEYDPPEVIPAESELHRPDEMLTAAQRQQKTALTFASPSAFDTKNTGVTLEGEASVVEGDDKMWNLMLCLTEVHHRTDASWVEETVTMPVFEVQSAKVSLRVKDGVWNLWKCTPAMTDSGKPDPGKVLIAFVKLTQVTR